MKALIITAAIVCIVLLLGFGYALQERDVPAKVVQKNIEGYEFVLYLELPNSKVVKSTTNLWNYTKARVDSTYTIRVNRLVY